jgi:hypothetical protein
MNKRYQIFISSTYADLVEERRYVMQALMEMDCIPAGMELFPAVDEEQWSFIKTIIDNCDYYLLIIGGRYGSLTDNGISYTEKEFDYAIEKGLKVVCLIHKNPGKIPFDKSEKNPEMQEKLDKFCDKVKKGRLVKFWEKPEELQGLVVLGLTQTIKRYPAVGFVRADLIPHEQTTAEILRLQNLVSDLKKELDIARDNPPPGTENLSQGNDEFEINITYQLRDPNDILFDTFGRPKQLKEKINCTWNQIFSSIAPMMVNESREEIIKNKIDDFITHNYANALTNNKRKNDREEAKDIHITQDDFNLIKIQFRALGLIKENIKNRSVKDTYTYWKLTPYGDNVMTRLIAIKKMYEKT